jgi:hypothetical protein
VAVFGDDVFAGGGIEAEFFEWGFMTALTMALL